MRAVRYRMADLRAWLGQVTGGLAVFAAAVVSTGILTHVNINATSALVVAGGVVAFVAAVLAGLQTFYKFGEAAENHRVAGADYGEVARKLDLFLAQYPRIRRQRHRLRTGVRQRRTTAMGIWLPRTLRLFARRSDPGSGSGVRTKAAS